MRVLREVEGQDEWLRAGVFDFHAAAIKRGLGDEADLGIEFTKFHILVIVYGELAHSASSTIGVEERWAFRAEAHLGAGLKDEAENGSLLVAEEIPVNDPLCFHTFTGEFFGGNGRT